MSLIIILSVGFGVLLLLIVVTVIVGVVFGCGKCRNDATEDTNAFYSNGANYSEFDRDDIDRQFGAVPAAAADDGANAYCSPGPIEPEDKDYKALGAVGPAEPPSDSSPPYYFSPEKDFTC